MSDGAKTGTPRCDAWEFFIPTKYEHPDGLMFAEHGRELERDLTEALKVAGEAEEFALRCIASDEVVIIKRLKEIERLKGEWDRDGLEKREEIASEVKALEERVRRSREWLAALERLKSKTV